MVCMVVLRICAPSERALIAKMRFVGSYASFSLKFLYTQYKPGSRGGQTCSIEESFAESHQKKQRAAKPVCNVNTNMLRMQVLH